MPKVTIELEEEERQILLMALAHLSIEKPGFDYALCRIARKCDNHLPRERAEVYDRFRELKQGTEKCTCGCNFPDHWKP